MTDKKAANQKVLSEASDIQSKTKESIWRIQKQAAEAEELGTQTLEELRRQGQQMDDINSELESVSAKLDKSKSLQSKFDRWAGNWLGGKKSRALKEASNEIAERNQQEYSKIKEVFEHQKFDPLSRSWKRAGMVLCTNPTVSCPDLFDPITQESLTHSNWLVDYNLTGLDSEGWTYSYDFNTLNKNGAGDASPKWNSYVRRRKWKYVERGSSGSAAVDEVKQRNEVRKAKIYGNSNRHAEKIGISPRVKATDIKESGYYSSSMTQKSNQQREELDNESAAGLAQLKDTDAEIDAGIESIGKSIDNLNLIAGTMRDEAQNQNAKLDKIDSNMQVTSEKQTVVNARQRYLLK